MSNIVETALRVFVFRGEAFLGSEAFLGDDPIQVGRGQGAALRLEAPTVSREHCTLTCVEQRIYVEDLASGNGTRVNGQRIADRAEVKPIDAIHIGPFELKVRGVPASPHENTIVDSEVTTHIEPLLAEEEPADVTLEPPATAQSPAAPRWTEETEEDTNPPPPRIELVGQFADLDEATVRAIEPPKLDLDGTTRPAPPIPDPPRPAAAPDEPAVAAAPNAPAAALNGSAAAPNAPAAAPNGSANLGEATIDARQPPAPGLRPEVRASLADLGALAQTPIYTGPAQAPWCDAPDAPPPRPLISTESTSWAAWDLPSTDFVGGLPGRFAPLIQARLLTPSPQAEPEEFSETLPTDSWPAHPDSVRLEVVARRGGSILDRAVLHRPGQQYVLGHPTPQGETVAPAQAHLGLRLVRFTSEGDVDLVLPWDVGGYLVRGITTALLPDLTEGRKYSSLRLEPGDVATVVLGAPSERISYHIRFVRETSSPWPAKSPERPGYA